MTRCIRVELRSRGRPYLGTMMAAARPSSPTLIIARGRPASQRMVAFALRAVALLVLAPVCHATCDTDASAWLTGAGDVCGITVAASTTKDLVQYVKDFAKCPREYLNCEYRIVLECKVYLLTETLFLAVSAEPDEWRVDCDQNWPDDAKNSGTYVERPPLTIESSEECPDGERATLDGSNDGSDDPEQDSDPVRVLDVSYYSRLTLRRVILTGGYGATYVRRTPRCPPPEAALPAPPAAVARA